MFTKPQLKVILLSSLGGGLEFYDFIIFAIFSPYLSQHFFPKTADWSGLVATFVVFAAGYVMRPLGGLLFSHYGDTLGRKKTFAFSISLMACSTFAIGILPGFAQWGYWATLLFICCRLLQGIALGGEIPGAITFVYEQISHRPATACGIVFLCINCGMLLAHTVNAGLLAIMGAAKMHAYGWRFAFIIGGALGGVSYWMRLALTESPLFVAKSNHDVLPIVTLWQQHRQSLVYGIIFSAFGAVLISMNSLFFPTFAVKVLHYKAADAANLALLFLVGLSCCIPFYGMLADRVGAAKVLLVGAAVYLVFGLFYYQALSAHWPQIRLLTVLFSLVNGMITSSFPVLIASLFPVSVRYTGIAASYNIGFAIFGGCTPALASLWMAHQQWSYVPYVITVVPGIIVLVLAWRKIPPRALLQAPFVKGGVF